MKIAEISKLFRVNEWYPDVFLWYMALLILTHSIVSVPFDILVLFAVYHFLMLCYCYLANSYADLEQDYYAAKKNIFTRLSHRMRVICVIVSSALIFVIPLIFFPGNPLVIVLAYTNLFLSAFYSFRPIRFKERGIFGLIVASLIQGAFAYLLFSLYAGIPLMVYIGFLLWIFLIEASDDLVHQVSDYLNDKKAKVSTFVIEHGIRRGVNLNKFLLWLSLIVPLIYLFQGIFKGIFITALLAAFTVEKFEHSRTELREVMYRIRKKRGKIES